MAINEDTIKSATLGSFNVALVGALGLINPLAAQLDLAIALGIGPFQADLATRLNAAVAAQANLSIALTGGDFAGALQASIRALAAINGALALPSPRIQTQLTASVALAAALRVQLGLLQGLIKASAAVKMPALGLLGQLAGALSAGPVVFFACTDGAPLSMQGAAIAQKFSTGLYDPDKLDLKDRILPGEPTYLVCLACKSPGVYASIQAIIKPS